MRWTMNRQVAVKCAVAAALLVPIAVYGGMALAIPVGTAFAIAIFGESRRACGPRLLRRRG